MIKNIVTLFCVITFCSAIKCTKDTPQTPTSPTTPSSPTSPSGITIRIPANVLAAHLTKTSTQNPEDKLTIRLPNPNRRQALQ